jgi:hypothetical protein
MEQSRSDGVMPEDDYIIITHAKCRLQFAPGLLSISKGPTEYFNNEYLVCYTAQCREAERTREGTAGDTDVRGRSYRAYLPGTTYEDTVVEELCQSMEDARAAQTESGAMDCIDNSDTTGAADWGHGDANGGGGRGGSAAAARV